MTELVIGFILSKDELVRPQANPWRTCGKNKNISLDKLCSDYLDSLSQLSFHQWFPYAFVCHRSLLHNTKWQTQHERVHFNPASRI